MPDVSLFESICKVLDITINEFILGEKMKQENYDHKAEETLITTIQYTNDKICKKEKKIGLLLIGVVILLTYICIIQHGNKGLFYLIVGSIVFAIGFFILIEGNKKRKIMSSVFISFIYLFSCVWVDYLSVKANPRVPYYIFNTKETNDTIMYQAPFYNVYRINPNTNQEYFILDSKNQYSISSIPISPFNRNISGFENIIKYRNKYVGNNSNDSKLIQSLPLAEYGYVFEIRNNNELIINYNISDWYINDSLYVYKSLLYNSVSIFLLIDNVDNITFQFVGSSYQISRSIIEKEYPNYDQIKQKNQLKEVNFNRYVENKMNDETFVKKQWKKLFIKCNEKD